MKRPLFILLTLLPALFFAQGFEISGTVKDADGKLLPFANVMLLRVADSTQIKGVSADETGTFLLNKVPADLYFLQARYFGYQSGLIPLEIKSSITIGAIVLEPGSDWLDEVIVTGQVPTVERLADRIVFQVENSIVAEGSTWDILRNTPGVIMVQDNLEIRGQSATIYLNDRKIQLTQTEIQDLLQGLGGSAIASIEVIPNPPANFEAEDGPVLNIRTRENITPGYKGSLRGEFTQSVFPKYSFGTSHYFKNDRISFFANYSLSPRKDFKRSESNINFINNSDQVFARWDTDLEKTTRSQAQQANLMLDYKLSEKELLNLTASGSISPNKRYTNRVQTLMRNGAGVLDSSLQTLSPLEDDLLNLSFDLNYERKLKKEGEVLKANAHYTYYDLSRIQDGSSDYFDASGDFLRNFSFSTDAGQDIDIYTGQLDYFLPLGSGNFEAGLKGSLIESGSRIDYFDVNDTQPPFDIALSDDFRYREGVLAAYASLSRQWGSWLLKTGLRAEQTDVKARSLTLTQTNTQSYLELFPSAFISKDLGNDNSLSLDYSRKLSRPNYADLNPFRYFLNENDFDEGNPNLVPAFSHNFNLNLSLKNTFFIDLYYRDNGQYISTLSFQDNQNQTLRQIKQNVQESTSYGLDFTVSTSLTSFWYLYSYNSLFYEDETFLAVESSIDTFTNKVTGFYGYLSNSFTLSGDGTFKGEASLLYLSGFLNGSYRMSETIQVDLGLRKSLWDNRAVVSITAEDLLRRANATYTSRYANQDNAFFARPETQFVRFAFTYNLGNYRLSNQVRTAQQSELERLDKE
ncbi:outer membrane beta-barrel protein [Robiginitalea sp. IMCC43444]|uniref:outer membrane beta-barrel protein n=1 Tax=Robiginitalea sp. IMCC43444 TaxID=3459121 RepID=UPI00404193DD